MNILRRARVSALACLALLGLGACVSSHQIQVAPVQVEPIRMTVDVNVHAPDAAPDAAPAKPVARNAP